MKYEIRNKTFTNQNFNFSTFSMGSIFLKTYVYVYKATLLILDWNKYTLLNSFLLNIFISFFLKNRRIIPPVSANNLQTLLLMHSLAHTSALAQNSMGISSM